MLIQYKLIMIYVLLLEHGKIYVGYTDRQHSERFMEHFKAEGSEWTKKYKPIELLEIREGTKDDEDMVTLELMQEIGWFNVRGGRWCKVNMTCPPEELTVNVPQNIKNAVKMAMSKPPIATPAIKKPKKKYVNYKRQNSYEYDNVTCYRCDREGHYANRCHAKTDVNGYYIN